eukprot:scaffold30710_cov61-Phaeocystis_antarctica.AAC.6
MAWACVHWRDPLYSAGARWQVGACAGPVATTDGKMRPRRDRSVGTGLLGCTARTKSHGTVGMRGRRPRRAAAVARLCSIACSLRKASFSSARDGLRRRLGRRSSRSDASSAAGGSASTLAAGGAGSPCGVRPTRARAARRADPPWTSMAWGSTSTYSSGGGRRRGAAVRPPSPPLAPSRARRAKRGPPPTSHCAADPPRPPLAVSPAPATRPHPHPHLRRLSRWAWAGRGASRGEAR